MMRRWRNILLLGVLLACAASLWMARRPATPAPPYDPAPDRSPAGAERRPEALRRTAHVTVLNGTGEAGLARRLSRFLPALGCVVVRIADAPHDSFDATLLINRRLPEQVARRLADDLGGTPVLREWDHRGQEDAVLVLGRDHARLAAALTGPP